MSKRLSAPGDMNPDATGGENSSTRHNDGEVVSATNANANATATASASESPGATATPNPNAGTTSRITAAIISLLLATCLIFGGCSAGGSSTVTDQASSGTGAQTTEVVTQTASAARTTIADIPQYSGALCIDINDGQPGFSKDDVDRGSFMQFSELDFEGRCGEAFACIGTDTVSSEARGDISRVHPSGWVQHKYDFVDDGVLYNRCHLIAHQLCGENANEKNLITGTRTFNVVGMLYYEELVGNYVRSTGNHVLYRVTPLFAANDLVARGVQMEAESVEDGGQAIRFNVFVYNVEPGVEIDYVTGESWESDATPEATSKGGATKTSAKTKDAALEMTAAELAASSGAQGTGEDASLDSSDSTEGNAAESSANSNANTSSTSPNQQEYVLNVKNKKFHKPDCTAASEIGSANKQDFTGTREELIERGYTPCGQCKP